MRFIYLLLVTLVLTTSLMHGQIRRGDLLLTPSPGNPAFLTASPLAVAGNAGSISRSTGDDGLVVAILPGVGYALTDGFVAGIGINLVAGRDTEGEAADGLSPYLRYYFVNNKLWHLYGGGRANVVLSNSDLSRSGRVQFQPTLGVGAAVGEGVFFSPELSYSLNQTNGPLQLALKFDVLLPARRRQRFAGQDRYERGGWMLGTRLGDLRLATANNDRNSFNFSPEIHYFAANQLALGLEAGTTISWKAGGATQKTVNGGLSLRYVPVHDRAIDLFAQGGLHVESAGSRMSERLDPDGGALFHADAGIGALIFPRDYFALEVGFGAAHFPVSGFTEMVFSGGVRIFPRN